MVWGKYLWNVWNNSEHVWIVSLKHLIINAVFPSFPFNVLTHEFELGGYLYQEHFQLPPIPLCPCKEPKMSSKQKKPPLDWVGPTLGKGNFAHRDPWKSAFSPNSGSLKLEPLFGQVPVNGLSDELLLGLVKGHFHPSEHICIQSEGKENMFHTNCLLFYCQG